MKIQRTFQFPLPLFGILPMVNVLFLVLVYYTMGSQFVQQPGVQVILTPSTFGMVSQRNTQIVSVTGAPTPSVYFRGKKLTIEELAARLQENKAADRTLVIKADKNSPAGLRDEIVNEGLRRGYSVIVAGELPPR